MFRTRSITPATTTDRAALSLVEYADGTTGETEPEFVIPEDLTALSDEELSSLHEAAVGHFDTLYGDGQSLSTEDMAALAALTEGIEALNAEIAARESAAAERAAAAAELAARVRPADESSTDGETDGPSDDADDAADGDADDATDEDEDSDEDTEGDDGAADTAASTVAPIAASASRRETRISLSGVRSRQDSARRSARPGAPRPAHAATGMRDLVLAAGDVPGFTSGQGMDWGDVGRAVDRRLAGYNHSQYARAAETQRHLREVHSVAVLRKPIPEDLMVTSNDPGHVDAVLQHAMDEHRLPGGSLVAAGGWCAPSETLYTMCELESTDGLVSIPEVGISRGGIQWTTGPSYSDIYNETGFCYTEQDDIDGDYDGEGGGSKPCYHVECPDFTEARLGLCGLCITAGLLMSRGYPEVIARTVRGALVAHEHRMSANVIAAMVTGSTAVTATPATAGTTAPLLSIIELQVEHYRYVHRMARTTTLEAIFPYWVRGAIRADLSRRQGVDLLSVTDAQINAWFALRGIAAQFVYDWQPLTGASSSALTWPTEVKFLLYSAGTWVKGVSDIITLDTIYDSTLLGTNDYTALFTEEGYLVAKMCQDSRVVTVPVCPDGATHGGIDIACDGTVTPAAVVPGSSEANPLYTSEVGA